jgi:undecaprenyl-diphosphatase
MLEYLKHLDLKILLAINSIHTPFLDDCMLFISHRYTWIPLYIFIIGFLFLKKKKEFLPAIIFIIAAAVCSDLFASSFMKPFFQRLRPCHNPEVNGLLYLIENICGGKYGFISSHAANTFALSTFLVLYLRKEYKWIFLFFIWAGIVSLSRVYLGVHYPADIAVGAFSGIIMAIIFFYAFRLSLQKFQPIKKEN